MRPKILSFIAEHEAMRHGRSLRSVCFGCVPSQILTLPQLPRCHHHKKPQTQPPVTKTNPPPAQTARPSSRPWSPQRGGAVWRLASLGAGARSPGPAVAAMWRSGRAAVAVVGLPCCRALRSSAPACGSRNLLKKMLHKKK